MQEILSQGVFGNRIPDVSILYQAATEYIETNYPMEDFVKDLGKLQNSTRNNMVFGAVRGRNLVADGRFVFRINHVASMPLLQIFHSESSAEKLISTISYTNEVMGFSLKLPEYWKSGYDTIQFHNQVVFYHKRIFEKYGKGSGMLFSITKLDRTQGDKMEELAEPGECLYWSKDVAYYWNIATDVQYPAWIDRDEEDKELAEQFENMLMDMEFVKNSFSFLEGSSEDTKLKTKANVGAVTTISDPPEHHTAGPVNKTIKAKTASADAYAGFEQLVVECATTEYIQTSLEEQGIQRVEGGNVNLREQYLIGEYSYKDNLAYETPEIQCDENGNISIYVSVNQDNVMKVDIYNAKTNESVGEYGVMANNKNVYTFLGFDPDETYRIALHGQTEDVWKIQGNYLIY